MATQMQRPERSHGNLDSPGLISRKPLLINAGKGAASHSVPHGDLRLRSGRQVMTVLIAGGMLEAPQTRMAGFSTL